MPGSPSDKHLANFKERDHKRLGTELDLFAFSDIVGKGLPLFTPKGATIRRELERFIVDEEIKRGYEHVVTPDIAKLDLYRKSGHYPHYKDSMYAPIQIDDEKFMLRPMTCPHHFELYQRRPVSYRELPMRIAELGKLYRYEQSGELMGLQRTRTFCLADAHIICADEEQAMEEIGGALDLIEYAAGIFGLVHGKEYWYRLSLGDRNNPKKYYKNDAAWEKGEDLLRKMLKKRKQKFTEAKNEAAFYGPKIDIQMKNVNGKEDTAFTVQYDFCMPDRFNLSYIGPDGNSKRAFVVHRSSIGAIERIMAYLIEHYAGAFPIWLAPVQVQVIAVSQKHQSYAKKIAETLAQENIRIELTDSNETLGKRIREGELQKIPYLLIVGEKEIKSQSVAIRKRGKGDIGSQKLSKFVETIKKEIASKISS
ncbi:MAG: threonine--tRNA ligase [Candidatus Colwellbacteria bacterium]|nr:threonine--tRNA ligase [Candidatus Colwellbacteria bacterium]